jgi:hypothetical protein
MGRQIADPQALHQRIDAPRGFPFAQALLEGTDGSRTSSASILR